jgi:hypothetical protein
MWAAKAQEPTAHLLDQFLVFLQAPRGLGLTAPGAYLLVGEALRRCLVEGWLLNQDTTSAEASKASTALKIESSVKVVVQHTRLDTTQLAFALMTTMASPAA